VDSATYLTAGGITIQRTTSQRRLTAPEPTAALAEELDSCAGILFDSAFEWPGRHRRWAIGFKNPPISITAYGRQLLVEALNDRGVVLLPMLASVLTALPAVTRCETSEKLISTTIRKAAPEQRFFEEDRGRQDSVFTVLRAIIGLFSSEHDDQLGLYGAFGYNLIYQIEHIPSAQRPSPRQRDLLLYLPDALLVVDQDRRVVEDHLYEFSLAGASTSGLPRAGSAVPYAGQQGETGSRDHAPGEYAQAVRQAKKAFRRGDLFEVVLSQAFWRPCPRPPSAIFQQLRQRNQAPYSALMNLGLAEYVVSSSPAMYVRVTNEPNGQRVESCPIAGTTARGVDALSDADAILGLLNSAKDTSELTMCTDVDRNDKSRVCVPGTVRVIGRRQIEAYAHVIHTMDHVAGDLRPGRDAIDAFLSHMWAVTITGAPKLWAMRFIEEHERTARGWYGGAMGYMRFNGEMSTGIVLCSLYIKDGTAQARAGATLLFDSDPDAEERESELKASLFLDVLRPASDHGAAKAGAGCQQTGSNGQRKRVLLMDHEDSFVHTLAAYIRQTGAEVLTVRAPLDRADLASALDRVRPDLLVLSPGPGQPSDFNMSGTIAAALNRRVPVFGVCLGFQGIVEYFGGRIRVLQHPRHGKSTTLRVRGGRIFNGIQSGFEVGLYHSLYAAEAELPAEISVTADADEVVMAIEHRELPVAATQFHPESVMTARNNIGLRLIANAVDGLARQQVYFAGLC
jgi:anthranilate synthase